LSLADQYVGLLGMDSQPATLSTSHDFDFLFGTWRVEHRRLTARLVGCDEWEEFDGTSVAYPILGGLGNIDDGVVNIPSGSYRAISLRSLPLARHEHD